MSICTVNGTAQEAPAGLQTWGELLASLERGDGPARTVVAAVRFAGVDQPTFRGPEALSLELSAAQPIDVELSTAQELIESARQSVLGELEALVTAARETADAFRLHDAQRAQSGLADFVSTFHLLTALSAAVGRADAANGDRDAETRGAEVLERLRLSLESLIEFDVSEDRLSVADVLEYEVADLLPMWGAVVTVAGESLVIHNTESAAGAWS